MKEFLYIYILYKEQHDSQKWEIGNHFYVYTDSTKKEEKYFGINSSVNVSHDCVKLSNLVGNKVSLEGKSPIVVITTSWNKERERGFSAFLL